jgi:uncharacterized membrane protein
MTQGDQRPRRLWEVDTIRGVAIVSMVFYHFVWDLNFFGLYQDMLVGPWQLFARGIATTFTLVMGLSLTLSEANYRRKTGTAAPFAKYLRRGLQILGWGMVITVSTYFFVGPRFVIFGVLHMLGTMTILAYPFLSWNKWVSLLVGLAGIGLGLILDDLIVSHPWLIWLGVKQAGRSMVDYYPLFPWGSTTLFGIFAGKSLFSQGQPRFTLPDLSLAGPVRGLRFLGRHSLLIYLLHQPLLIGAFLALGYGR